MDKITNFLNAKISGLVTSKPEILADYARDASILEIMPKLLCIPESVEDVQYLVRFANELAKKGYQLPVVVRGSGLDQSGADLTEGMIISTEKLNQIQEIDDRVRLVRVQAGVTLGQLNSALALFGLRLPIEADPRETIGGLVSNFNTDKIAKKYGSIYYYVDRIEAVLSNGDLFQSQTLNAHGLKYAKNKKDFVSTLYQGIDQLRPENKEQLDDLKENNHARTGYHMITEVQLSPHEFDLSPLFFGAQGSLGVITELILKVIPLSRPTKQALFGFRDLKTAVDFMSELKKLQPLRIDFYDRRLVNLEQVKTLTIGLDLGETKYLICTEFDDNYFKNQSNLKRLKKLSYQKELAIIDQPEITNLIAHINKSLTAYRNDSSVVERVIIADRSYIPETEFYSFVDSIKTLEKIFDQELPLFGSFMTNLYSLRPSFDLSQVNDRKQLLRFLQQYSKLVYDSNGNLCGGSAEGQVQALMVNQNTSARTLNLYHQIKTLFDPHNILNPKIKQGASLANVARFMRISAQIGLIRQD